MPWNIRNMIVQTLPELLGDLHVFLHLAFQPDKALGMMGKLFVDLHHCGAHGVTDKSFGGIHFGAGRLWFCDLDV